MKAWICSYDDGDSNHSTVVWNKTSGRAKAYAAFCGDLGDPDFTQVSCRRAKWADGMMGMSESDFQLEQLKRDWVWRLAAGEEIDSSTLPLIEKYGGTIDTFINAYEEMDAPIKYGENGFYEEESK